MENKNQDLKEILKELKGIRKELKDYKLNIGKYQFVSNWYKNNQKLMDINVQDILDEKENSVSIEWFFKNSILALNKIHNIIDPFLKEEQKIIVNNIEKTIDLYIEQIITYYYEKLNKKHNFSNTSFTTHPLLKWNDFISFSYIKDMNNLFKNKKWHSKASKKLKTKIDCFINLTSSDKNWLKDTYQEIIKNKLPKLEDLKLIDETN